MMDSANTMSTEAQATALKDRIFDPVLLIVYIALLALGTVAVYSATIAYAYDGGDSLHYIRRHLAHAAFAVASLFAATLIPPWLWRKMSVPLLLAGVVLLVLPLMPYIGVELNGSKRWIRVMGLTVQGSEFAELFFIVFVAKYLAEFEELVFTNARAGVALGAMFLVYAALLLLEPDLGSAVVLATVLLAMLYLAGLKYRHFFVFFICGVLAVALLIIIEPYRLQRLLSFTDPFADPYGSGFQLVQSLIAFGQGGWFGSGIGTSVLKLFYLPQAESDFLFAIIGEEFGFVGVVTLISLFCLLVFRAFQIAKRARAVGDVFSERLAQGIGVMFAVTAIINMGVNLGLLPTKGLALPFFSVGGTSLVASSIVFGILLSIERSLRWDHQS